MSAQAAMMMGQQGMNMQANMLQGYLGYQQAKREDKSLRYQAGLIEQDAELNEEILEERYEAFQGTQIKDFSVSGVKLEGTASDVLAKTSRNKYRDIANLRIAAKRQATSLRWRGSQIKHKGKLDMISSFMGSSGQGASAYGSYQGTGK